MRPSADDIKAVLEGYRGTVWPIPWANPYVRRGSSMMGAVIRCLAAAALVAAATGCRKPSSLPANRELVRTARQVNGIAPVAGTGVVFRVTKPDAEPPTDTLYLIPPAGGEPALIAEVPHGELVVGSGQLFQVALNGSIYRVHLPEGGASRIARVGDEATAGAVVGDRVVVGVNAYQPEHAIAAVELGTGRVHAMASRLDPGPHPQTDTIAVASAGGVVYAASMLHGIVVAVSPDGAATSVAIGQGRLSCLVATPGVVYWYREREHALVAASGGGPPQIVAHAQGATLSCAASGERVVYADGEHLLQVSRSQRPRPIARVHGRPRAIAADGTRAYWAEPTSDGWSIRSAPLLP